MLRACPGGGVPGVSPHAGGGRPEDRPPLLGVRRGVAFRDAGPDLETALLSNPRNASARPNRLVFCRGRAIICRVRRTARWCNGSTTDSGSVCLGSSPGRAAIRRALGKAVGLLRAFGRGARQASQAPEPTRTALLFRNRQPPAHGLARSSRVETRAPECKVSVSSFHSCLKRPCQGSA